MRRISMLVVPVVVSLLAAGCGGAGSPASSTTETPTTRAAQPGSFVPERPGEQALGLYLFYATQLLSETPWTQEAMSTEPWFRMLENGALAACGSYHGGASTVDTIRNVIDRSEVPLQDTPSSDDVDAYDLLSSIFIGGIDAYCPELITTIYGSVFNIGFDKAWEHLTGGPAPDRPIRLP